MIALLLSQILWAIGVSPPETTSQSPVRDTHLLIERNKSKKLEREEILCETTSSHHPDEA